MPDDENDDEQNQELRNPDPHEDFAAWLVPDEGSAGEERSAEARLRVSLLSRSEQRREEVSDDWYPIPAGRRHLDYRQPAAPMTSGEADASRRDLAACRSELDAAVRELREQQDRAASEASHAATGE